MNTVFYAYLFFFSWAYSYIGTHTYFQKGIVFYIWSAVSEWRDYLAGSCTVHCHDPTTPDMSENLVRLTVPKTMN